MITFDELGGRIVRSVELGFLCHCRASITVSSDADAPTACACGCRYTVRPAVHGAAVVAELTIEGHDGTRQTVALTPNGLAAPRRSIAFARRGVDFGVSWAAGSSVGPGLVASPTEPPVD